MTHFGKQSYPAGQKASNTGVHRRRDYRRLLAPQLAGSFVVKKKTKEQIRIEGREEEKDLYNRYSEPAQPPDPVLAEDTRLQN